MTSSVPSTACRSPLGSFLSGLRCFARLQSMNIKSQMVYTLDAWLEMALFALHQFIGLMFLWVIFTRVRAVGGWSLPEIVFLYGLLILSMALYRLVFQGVRDTGMMILHGALDQVLTKPRSLLLLLGCRRSNPSGIGDLLTGFALVILAGVRMGYAWTPGKAAQLLLFILSANAVMVAVMLAQAATCFWLVRFTVLHELVMALRRFCYYPLTIFGVALQVLLSVVLPLAFCSYYPAAVLLAKDGFSAAWCAGPPLVAAGCLAAAILVFNRGLRRYESAGS